MRLRKISLLVVLSMVFGASLSLAGPTQTRCSHGRCFSNLDPATQKQVLNGQTVSKVNSSDTKFDVFYVYKRVRGVDPELAMGIFATFAEHNGRVPGIKESVLLGQEKGSVRVRYKLSVGEAGAGALAKLAPDSRYVLDEILQAHGDGYVITWEINQGETKRLPGSKPDFVHGFMMVEPIEGTNDSVITYANYVVPAGRAARFISGKVNRGGIEVLKKTTEAAVRWMEEVANRYTPEQIAAYRANCQDLLSK